MKYKVGDILRGKINGRELEILAVSDYGYKWRDLKYGTVFHTHWQRFERCLFDKVN